MPEWQAWYALRQTIDERGCKNGLDGDRRFKVAEWQRYDLQMLVRLTRARGSACIVETDAVELGHTGQSATRSRPG